MNSARFGYQKMVNAINPDSVIRSLFRPRRSTSRLDRLLGTYHRRPAPDHSARSFRALRQQHGLPTNHTIRFGGAIHRIDQGDFYAPGNFGPSVTSSNGIDAINAINGNPLPLFQAIRAAPPTIRSIIRSAPVTIFNGLGNFSEHSAFNRSTGGHSDTRLEGYFGDTFNVFPNLNISFGVNYVRDSGRTNSDLAARSVFGDQHHHRDHAAVHQWTDSRSIRVSSRTAPTITWRSGSSARRPYQPDWNFAPQVGLAWDPGHNGRTVFRASGGMFYDNFLLQNTYQDRINRLSNGQYNRSLTLCPTGIGSFPDAAVNSDAS